MAVGVLMDVLYGIWVGAYLWMIFLVAWWQWSRTRMPVFPLRVISELWPFVPYIMVIDLGLSVWGESPAERWWEYAVKGIALAGWAMTPPPDDRWKRRRKKLAGKVSMRRGRLVVSAAKS